MQASKRNFSNLQKSCDRMYIEKFWKWKYNLEP